MHSSSHTQLKFLRVIILFIAALFLVLFIYTATNKILDFNKFKHEMGRSPFISYMAGAIAVAVPAGELLISVLLVLNRTRLLGFYVSFFLMALFTGYIWLMLNYASDLPCSCGGVLAKMTWHDHLVFNAIFTAIGILGILLQTRLDRIATLHTTVVTPT